MSYESEQKLQFPDKSTEAIFEPTPKAPPAETITACAAFAFDDDGNALLIKPDKRG